MWQLKKNNDCGIETKYRKAFFLMKKKKTYELSYS